MARRVAVCVGENTYDQVRPILHGCVNDALLIGSMLSRAGFEVHQLHDQAATQRAILTALETEVATLRDGDHLVFWNSSHGYQVQDRSGDEQFDYQDEAICTYETNGDDPLTDDKFQRILGRANPRASIFFGSDSCHSGTLTREILQALLQAVDAEWTTDPRSTVQYRQRLTRELDQLDIERALEAGLDASVQGEGSRSAQETLLENRQPRLWLPPENVRDRSAVLLDLNQYLPAQNGGSAGRSRELALEDYRLQRMPVRRLGGLSRDLDESQMGHLLLSGCAPSQLSDEVPFPQRWHGVMTYYFATTVLEAWAHGQPITYRQAHKEACQRITSAGFPQTPQLEGPDRLKDAPVFGHMPSGMSHLEIQPNTSPEPQSLDAQRFAEVIHARIREEPWFGARLRADPWAVLRAYGVPANLVNRVLRIL